MNLKSEWENSEKGNCVFCVHLIIISYNAFKAMENY